MLRIVKDCTQFPKGKSYESEEVKTFLAKQFNKKCCYCETANIKGEVEHFRPQSVYTWLKDECENLLWACHDCNHLKSDKMPIVEKKAKKPDSVYICNEKEQLRMIDPTRKNDVLKFEFDKTGKIKGQTELMCNTINICKLDRDNLNDARLKVYQELEADINSLIYLFSDKSKVKEHIEKTFNEPIKQNKELDFVAFRRYIVNNWLNELLP